MQQLAVTLVIRCPSFVWQNLIHCTFKFLVWISLWRSRRVCRFFLTVQRLRLYARSRVPRVSAFLRSASRELTVANVSLEMESAKLRGAPYSIQYNLCRLENIINYFPQQVWRKRTFLNRFLYEILKTSETGSHCQGQDNARDWSFSILVYLVWCIIKWSSDIGQNLWLKGWKVSKQRGEGHGTNPAARRFHDATREKQIKHFSN